MPELYVYVSETCWACEEARKIVTTMKSQFPAATIELRDLEDEQRPKQVFATPTYVLDGRTIFLGNPTREELAQKLSAVDGEENPAR